MSHDPHVPDDPLNLEAVDREIRINELTEEVKSLGGEEMYVSEECPPEMHEEFLRNMLAFEKGPFTTHFKMLEKAGVALPPPESLDDAALTAKLWEVINALAGFSAFLYSTDHLSDRELYDHLWRDTLREETTAMPPGSGWVCHVDLLGSGSEEDILNHLRYYEDEEGRRRWQEDFPDYEMPEREKAPYDRDRHLPRPPADAGFSQQDMADFEEDEEWWEEESE